ncbi:hypothetical protein GGD67_005982 [Bradyrhizobium sp. IAR9]|nr:hypothetical protein [Bradyrhizobium sp. IAR9]
MTRHTAIVIDITDMTPQTMGTGHGTMTATKN